MCSLVGGGLVQVAYGAPTGAVGGAADGRWMTFVMQPIRKAVIAISYMVLSNRNSLVPTLPTPH